MAENPEHAHLQDTIKILSSLVLMQERLRDCTDLQSACFFMAHQTYELVPYRQACIWTADQDNKKTVTIQSISNVSDFDQDAPQIVWLKKEIKKTLSTAPEPQKSQLYSVKILDIDTASFEKDNAGEWSASYALHCIMYRNGEPCGGLWIDRDTSFHEKEHQRLEKISSAYAEKIWSFQNARQNGLFQKLRTRRSVFAAIIFTALFLIPVRHSVTAPVEIIAQDPFPVTTAINGTIEDIKVEPNQSVQPGDVLLHLDKTVLQNRLDLASKAVDLARARYAQASQQAFNDPEAKARTAILNAELEMARIRLSQAQKDFEKSTITASRAGRVLFADPHQLIGRPVQTGERIMSITDPQKVQAEINIPAANMIHINQDKPIHLFLNVDPAHTLRLTLTDIGFEAVPDAQNQLVHKLKADFPDQTTKNLPEIGLRGSAKVYGNWTVLGMKILKRPLLFMRRHLGV